jgi:hypothetical protein
MENMGNGKAKELYEQSLPEYFRRPNESDGYALEQFIRAKYERKEYMSKSGREDLTKKESVKVAKTPSSGSTKKPKPIMEIKETVQVTKTTKILDNGPDLMDLNESEVPRHVDPQFSVFQSATTVTSTSFVSASPSMFPTQTIQTTTTSQTDFGPFFASGNEPQSASKASILQLYNTPLTQSNTSMAPMPTTSSTTSSVKTMGPNYDVVLTGLNAPKQPIQKPPMNMQPAYGMPNYVNPTYMATNPNYGNPNFVNPGYMNPPARPMQMPPNPNFVNTSGYVNPNFAAKMNNSTGKFM